MEDIRISIITLINKAIQRLLVAQMPPEALRSTIYQLVLSAEQVYQPCVVAVIGQVNSGKSTFINALLGEDLTKVGTTETTATINYFRYGNIGSEGQVRCFWRNGEYEYVDLDFVNRLQGNAPETLERARNIDHMEYYLPRPFLQDVTLVDTPGLEAAVEEHQLRTSEFVHLESQLNQSHANEMEQIGSQADAVIYLVSATPLESDRAFLEAFQQVTQGQTRSFNSLAVMTKIDNYPDLVERREAQARRMADQLKHLVNTVVPVSAGLQRLLDRLLEQNKDEFKHLMEVLVAMPPARVEKMLDGYELFLELMPAEHLSQANWDIWLKNTPWMVFKTVAQMSVEAARAGMDMETVIHNLYTVAGFDRLKEVLEKHFFERSYILRSLRILHDIRHILEEVKYTELPRLRRKEDDDRARQERFIAFVRETNGKPEVAREIREFMSQPVEYVAYIDRVLDELNSAADEIDRQLRQYSLDFEALQQLAEQHDVFTALELDELQPLLGLYGLTIERRLPGGNISVEYIQQRQLEWREVRDYDEDPVRRAVARQAESRYSALLRELHVREKRISGFLG